MSKQILKVSDYLYVSVLYFNFPGRQPVLVKRKNQQNIPKLNRLLKCLEEKEV